MADPAMISKYLQSRGVPMSAENSNMVREHYAANPDMLDRRALGLPGGLDDNSSILDAMLSKHVADTMPAPAGTVTVGDVEAIPPQGDANPVPPSSKTGARVPGPKEVGGTASRQGNYGPGASPSRQGGYGEANAPRDPTGAAVGSAAGSARTSGTGDWLTGLLGALGVGAAAYGVNRAMKGAGGATTGPTAATIPGESVGGETAGMSEGTKAASTSAPKQTPEDVARLRAEVDMENDAMMRQMEEQARKQRSQRNAQETINAAKRATGRR